MPDSVEAIVREEAALEFYADPANWDHSTPDYLSKPAVEADQGELAREALAELRGGRDG